MVYALLLLHRRRLANLTERGLILDLTRTLPDWEWLYVTHLVRILDRQSEHEEWQGEWSLYRIVEVVWALDCSAPSASAKADIIFGFPGVLAFMGGNAMRLEDLPTFKNAWDAKGGLAAFQTHIQTGLLAI